MGGGLTCLRLRNPSPNPEETPMSCGPNLEQIAWSEPTFRVESYLNGERFVHAELCTPDEGIGIARQVWATEQPLDEIRVVNERTGFTQDTISRDVHHLSYAEGGMPTTVEE